MPVTSNIDSTSFYDGAKIGYNKIHDEIYVINPSYDYCYVRNLSTNFWYKHAETFDDVFNVGQNSFVTRNSDNSLFRLFEEYSYGVFPFKIETKPTNLGFDGFKKINRIVIRGHFIPEGGMLSNVALNAYNKCIAAYVFGSLDGIKFSLIDAKQSTLEIKGIVFNEFPMSLKYIAIIITGHLTKESYITHADIDFERKYEKKLR